MMKRLPKKEVGEIAKGIVQDQIFCSCMAPDHMIESIFMPLVFMSKGDIPEEEIENIGQVIGYMKDTFRMCVNGYPIFSACQFIHKEDWKLIVEKVKRMKKAIERITGEKPSKNQSVDYSI